jgi:hypothetical protein
MRSFPMPAPRVRRRTVRRTAGRFRSWKPSCHAGIREQENREGCGWETAGGTTLLARASGRLSVPEGTPRGVPRQPAAGGMFQRVAASTSSGTARDQWPVRRKTVGR